MLLQPRIFVGTCQTNFTCQETESVTAAYPTTECLKNLLLGSDGEQRLFTGSAWSHLVQRIITSSRFCTLSPHLFMGPSPASWSRNMLLHNNVRIPDSAAAFFPRYCRVIVVCRWTLVSQFLCRRGIRPRCDPSPSTRRC